MSRQRKNLQEFRKKSSLVAGGAALAGLASLSNPVAAQAGEAAKKFTYDPSKGPTTPGLEIEGGIGNNVYKPHPFKETDQVIHYDLYDRITGEYKGTGYHPNPEYADPSAAIPTDPSVLSPDLHHHLLSTKTGMAIAGGAALASVAYGAMRLHQNNKIKKFELGSEVSGNHFGKNITGHVVGHEIKHSFGIPKGYVKVMNAEDQNIYDMHPKETNLTKTNILGLSENIFFGGQNFQIGDEVVQTKEDPNSIPVAAVYGSNVHGKVIDLGTEEHSHLVHIRDFHTGVIHTINKRYLKKIGSNQQEQEQMNEEYYDDASESPNLVPLVKSIMSGQPATTQDMFKDAMKEKLIQAVDFYKQTQLSGVFNDSPSAINEGKIRDFIYGGLNKWARGRPIGDRIAHPTGGLELGDYEELQKHLKANQSTMSEGKIDEPEFSNKVNAVRNLLLRHASKMHFDKIWNPEETTHKGFFSGEETKSYRKGYAVFEIKHPKKPSETLWVKVVGPNRDSGEQEGMRIPYATPYTLEFLHYNDPNNEGYTRKNQITHSQDLHHHDGYTDQFKILKGYLQSDKWKN